MKRLLMFLFAVTFLFGAIGHANAATIGFVSNPTTNLTDWTNSVVGNGGTVNSNVNFDAHPLGILQNNFYTISDGVTFSTTGGGNNTITSGAGPGQSGTVAAPLSSGEGPHAVSNFLYDTQAHSALTISFGSPVLGAGLFVIDLFNPTIWNERSTLEAFTGQNGTGSSLAIFSAADYNFQKNNMYFMGIASDIANIGSVVYTDINGLTTDLTGIDDIRFATGAEQVPAPEPATIALLGIGLVGLAGVEARRRRKKIDVDNIKRSLVTKIERLNRHLQPS
ncbi:MAG: PEP-CTERM sorting domain-containing protein [Planctomycetota bacterium]|jgi:hypothetical protein